MADEKVTNTITNADLNKVVEGITLRSTFKVRENEDMSDDRRKTINLEVDYSGVTLNGVFAKTLKPTIIQVQGKVRNNWAKYLHNQTVKVKFVAPTETYVDPITRLLAEATQAGIDTTDKEAFMAYILNRTTDLK